MPSPKNKRKLKVITQVREVKDSQFSDLKLAPHI